MTRKPIENGTKNRKGKADNPRGQMKAFTPKQIDTLATFLRESDKRHAKRDYALMCAAYDTMLRSSDLLKLTFGDVLHNGVVVEDFQVQQKKTGELVSCILTETTREALSAYIDPFAPSVKGDPTRRLFPITTEWFRKLIKDWCRMLRLDPTRYSGHSFRRTKAKQVYAETKNVALCKELLGHADLQHTQRYLGVERADAMDVARRISILKK
jgi:integrase